MLAEGCIKINFDAHLSPGGEVGLGVVCRDHQGQLVASGVRRVEARWEASLAEAMGARYALELAGRSGFAHVALEGDSLEVINAVKTRGSGLSPSFRIFSDIITLASSLESFFISHIKRAGNVVAHLLARWDCPSGNEIVWMDYFPQSINYHFGGS